MAVLVGGAFFMCEVPLHGLRASGGGLRDAGVCERGEFISREMFFK